MRLLSHLAIYTAITLCAAGEPAADRKAVLEDAARTAGIEQALVLDPNRRRELVAALQRRITQGYLDEKAFRIKLEKLDPPKADYPKLYRPYLDTRAKGCDRALFLASEFRCVELVPLLVKQGDMKVLDFGTVDQKGEDARAVKAIVAMGLKAAEPLFEVVQRSPHARERYYAICALQLGKTAWKDELAGKDLAERMAERCDTTKPAVQLALALLKGHIHDPKTAAGEDLDQR